MSNESEPMAAKFAREVYAKLEKEGITEVVDGDAYCLWRGNIGELFQAVGASTSHYSKIRAILLNTGSIEIAVRGTKAYPSILVLRHPPPAEIPAEHLTLAHRPATLDSVDERVSILEGWRETLGKGELNLGETLRNFEMRLRALESKMGG